MDEGNHDKPPISDRKIAANRRNAERSTGPKTEAGKARSAQNAVTHGLWRREPCLAMDREEFTAYAEALRADLPADDALEAEAAERYIDARWREREAARHQTGIQLYQLTEDVHHAADLGTLDVEVAEGILHARAVQAQLSTLTTLLRIQVVHHRLAADAFADYNALRRRRGESPAPGPAAPVIDVPVPTTTAAVGSGAEPSAHEPMTPPGSEVPSPGATETATAEPASTSITEPESAGIDHASSGNELVVPASQAVSTTDAPAVDPAAEDAA